MMGKVEEVVSIERLDGTGFSIELEDRAGYLRVLVRGDVDTQAVSVAYWTMIGVECSRRGTTAVLVVEDLPAWPNVPAEVFEAVTDAAVAAGLREVRCAFVDQHEEVEANEYGMMIGTEKGLTIMMFSNESYAEHWLRFGSPKSDKRHSNT